MPTIKEMARRLGKRGAKKLHEKYSSKLFSYWGKLGVAERWGNKPRKKRVSLGEHDQRDVSLRPESSPAADVRESECVPEVREQVEGDHT